LWYFGEPVPLRDGVWKERVFIAVFVSVNVLEAGWVGMAKSCVLWNEEIGWIDSNYVVNI
jgi:hypothetical protein